MALGGREGNSASVGEGGATAHGGAGGIGGATSNAGGNAGAGASGSGGNGAGGEASGGNGAGGEASGGNGAGGEASGGNGGAGGAPLLEDCTNGLDDDGDSAIDCADLECDPGYTCSPNAPPGGWQGPVAFWQGGAMAPSCDASGGYPTMAVEGFDGLSAPAASCPTCSCTAPKGVSCSIAQASFFGNDSCAGNGGTLNIVAGVCQGFVSQIDPASFRWQSASASGGVCIPKASGVPSVPAVMWATHARACGDAEVGGGCEQDSACVPRPSAPFGAGLCVYRAGDHPCPSGAYPNRTLLFEAVDDSRTCSDCDCGDPVNTSCGGTLQVSSDLNCSVDTVTLSAVNACGKLAPDPTPPPPPSSFQTLRSILYSPGPGPVAGSCATIPSTPTGTAAPSAPITLCCAP
jgi:hypothetical protein